MEQKKLSEYLPMSLKCEHCGLTSTYHCEKITCFKPVSYQPHNSLYQKFCARKHHALAIERRSVNSSIPHSPQHLAGAHQINSFVFNEKINDRYLKNPEVCIISLMTHPYYLKWFLIWGWFSVLTKQEGPQNQKLLITQFSFCAVCCFRGWTFIHE